MRVLQKIAIEILQRYPNLGFHITESSSDLLSPPIVGFPGDPVVKNLPHHFLDIHRLLLC